MSKVELLDELENALDAVLAKLRALAGSELPDDPVAEPVPLRRRASELSSRLGEAAALAKAYQDRVEAIHAAWRDRHRFTRAGLEEVATDLTERFHRQPEGARAALLAEIAAATRALEVDHAVQLLRRCSDWSSVPPEVRDDLEAWSSGDLARGARAVATLTALATRGGRRRSHKTAVELELTLAWLRIKIGDESASLEILDRLVAGAPMDAELRVERAGLLLLTGRPEVATDDAHRAIELDPGSGRAYLQAGLVAEATGSFSDATELYGEASRRLPTVPSAPDSSATFLQPTGLSYLIWADRHRGAQAREALAAVEKAIALGIAGITTYPDADGHELRWRLLSDLGAPDREVAEAALNAGKHLYWNNEYARAYRALDVVTKWPREFPESGWIFADCARLDGWNDLERLRATASFWDGWISQVGPPGGSSDGWAYGVRAVIAERIASLEGKGYASAVWQGVVFSEQGLVLNSLDIFSWTLLSRFYHLLSMYQLAREASDAAFRINPDDQQMLNERLAALGDANADEEALETLERMNRVDTDPWLATVKAELLKRQGRSAEALACLSLEPTEPSELGWFRSVRAECYVDLGRVDEAVAELRTMVAEEKAPASGQAFLRHVYARSVLGNLDVARRMLKRAENNATLDYNGRVLAIACVALAEGEPERAFDEVARTLPGTPDPVSIGETFRSLERALILLAAGGHPMSHATPMLERARELVLRSAGAPPDADTELQLAIARNVDSSTDELQRVALLATQGRRLAERSRYEDAADVYQALAGTRFEPEASRALGDTLGQEYMEAIRHGDVERTRSLYPRLEHLGRAPTPNLELAVAQALHQRRDYGQAVRMLNDVLPSVREPHERLSVLELLGECAVLSGQSDVAGPSLQEALGLALDSGDRARAAQIAVRRAFWHASRMDLESAEQDLAQALELWAASGTWSPESILRLETDSLAEGLPAHMTQVIAPLLEKAVRQANPS